MGVLGAKFLKDRKKKASKVSGMGGSGIMPGETVADLYKKKLSGKVAGGAIGAMGSKIGRRAGPGAAAKKDKDRPSMRDKELTRDSARVKKKMGGGMMMAPRGAMGAMGGGMATPMGYKKGRSVKVKCKLGRNKPTKMY